MYSTVQYNNVQYSTVTVYIVQYSTIMYSTVTVYIVQYSTIMYSTVQYSIVQYCIVQYSSNSTCTVQYSIAYRVLHSREGGYPPWMYMSDQIYFNMLRRLGYKPSGD